MEGQVLKLCVFTFLFGLIAAEIYQLDTPHGEINENEKEATFTKWLNADPMGFFGDFENIPRQEFASQRSDDKECRVPCKYPEATKVRLVKYRDDPALSDWILDNCLHLDWTEKWFKTEGYYCINYIQRDPKYSRCLGDSPKNKRCREYMGDDCECPDAEVQFLCRGTMENMIKYCASKGQKLKQEIGGTEPSKWANNLRSLDEKKPDSIEDILSNFIQDRKDVETVKRKLEESEKERKLQDTQEVAGKDETADKLDDKVLRDLLAKLT